MHVPLRHEAFLQARCFGEHVTYQAGVTLFREGDAVRQVALLRYGLVKLLGKHSSQGVLVAIRTPGWLLGVASALTNQPHVATAVTLTDCELRVTSTSDFQVERRNVADVQEALLAMLAAEVRDAQLRWTSFAARDNRLRLQQLFLDLMVACGQVRPDGSVKLKLVLSVTEISELILASRQWTSKCLSAWERQGALKREKDWFVAPSGSSLATLVASTLDR